MKETEIRVENIEFGVMILLRLGWIAGILPILIAYIPWCKLNWFRDLLSHFAGRGKTLKSSSLSKLTVPQKFFGHFYVWAVIWTTSLLAATWLYAYSSTRIWHSVFLLLLMEAQVLRRLYETKYVFKYSPSARMHIIGYITGLYFYTAAPLSLCYTHMADMFQVSDQKWIPETNWSGYGFPFMKLGWHSWFGAVIFLQGWIHQRKCHSILGMVREKSKRNDDYAILYGDWFRYVSSPHYLAEIVIYAGIVIASGCSDITVWLLFMFVVANLAFAAAETHRWYQRKFKNYPRDRFAIIPYMY